MVINFILRHLPNLSECISALNSLDVRKYSTRRCQVLTLLRVSHTAQSLTEPLTTRLFLHKGVQAGESKIKRVSNELTILLLIYRGQGKGLCWQQAMDRRH